MDSPEKRHLAERLRTSFTTMTPTERIETFIAFFEPGSTDARFTTPFMTQNLSLISATVLSKTSCKVIFRFPVTRLYCNTSGNLHGGAQATIFDMLTSISLTPIATPEFWMNGGVSRTLNVSYLRPAPEGETLECECEVVHAGKALALIRGVFRRVSDGAVVSTCEHHKAAVVKKEFKL
ncbi:hypothetical protein MBLNU230_g5706t1 [Neophaeotheca triangularis]